MRHCVRLAVSLLAFGAIALLSKPVATLPQYCHEVCPIPGSGGGSDLECYDLECGENSNCYNYVAGVCPPAAPEPDQNDPVPVADEWTVPETEDPEGVAGVWEEATGWFEGYPFCSSLMKYGNVGYIAIQMSPTRSLQWGAYMYRPYENWGWWIAELFVSGVRRDAKNQYYPPHGSLPEIPSGAIVTLWVGHVYFSYNYVGGGFGFWSPALAEGTVTCVAD